MLLKILTIINYKVQVFPQYSPNKVSNSVIRKYICISFPLNAATIFIFFFPTGVLAEGKSLQALVLEDYIFGYNCGKKSFLFGNFLAKMDLPFKK